MSDPSVSAPKKPTGRRAPVAPTSIPNTGPNWKKIAPYAVTGLIVAILVGLVRSSRYGSHGSLAIGFVFIALLAYMALGSRESLAKDDGLRKALVASVLAVVVATAVPLFYTVFPPAPRAVTTLSQVGEVQSLDVQTGIDCWTAITAQLAANATGHGDFSIEFSKVGAGPTVTERVSARLRPQPGGGMLTERIELHAVNGPGVIRAELRGISSAVQAPLRVSIFVRPIPALWLAAAYALLFLLSIVVDVGLFKRGSDPSFATAMGIPLVAVGFLQFRVVGGESLGTDLLAALAVGVIAGGLGGEGLARLGRMGVKN